MNQESWEYYNIAAWQREKVNYNRISKFNANRRRQVLHGQIWYCDLGYNVGTEKNKMRPVLVMSNNRINNSEKVVVVCITDAKGKTNAKDVTRGCIGTLTPDDFAIVKGKFKRAYNL